MYPAVKSVTIRNITAFVLRLLLILLQFRRINSFLLFLTR